MQIVDAVTTKYDASDHIPLQKTVTLWSAMLSCRTLCRAPARVFPSVSRKTAVTSASSRYLTILSIRARSRLTALTTWALMTILRCGNFGLPAAYSCSVHPLNVSTPSLIHQLASYNHNYGVIPYGSSTMRSGVFLDELPCNHSFPTPSTIHHRSMTMPPSTRASHGAHVS